MQDVEDPSLSFHVLQDLHIEFLLYLKTLLHHIITLAEHSNAQTPNEPSEVTSDHVYQALALRGEPFPNPVVTSYLTKLSQKENDVEAEMSKIKRARLSTFIDPPGEISWWQMSLAEAEPSAPTEEDNDAELEFRSSTSDEEDEQLDGAMDRMDQANDEAYERNLWAAVEADQAKDAGVVGGSKSAMRGRPRKPHRENFDDGITSADDGAKRGRAAFVQLQLNIGRDRRHRHSLKYRSVLFPTTALKLEGRRSRSGISAAMVIDTDSEEERSGLESEEEDELEDEDEEWQGEKEDEFEDEDRWGISGIYKQ